MHLQDHGARTVWYPACRINTPVSTTMMSYVSRSHGNLRVQEPLQRRASHLHDARAKAVATLAGLKTTISNDLGCCSLKM